MKRALRYLVLVFAFLATPAFADMTANYVGPNNAVTMKLEIATNGDLRVSTSDPNAYFITRDGHGYFIKAGFNGPIVMRVEDIAVVMDEQVKRFMSKLPSIPKEVQGGPELKKGSPITVRGRTGTPYFMGPQDRPSETNPPMVVISTDPALAPLAAAMARQFAMSSAMMPKALGSNPFSDMDAALKTGAPLATFGMELDTVSTDPIPASRFELPAEPVDLDGVRKNMGAPASPK